GSRMSARQDPNSPGQPKSVSCAGLATRYRCRQAQPSQLATHLGLIRGDLEQTLILEDGVVPLTSPHVSARQGQAGLKIAWSLAENGLPLVHRLVVLVRLPQPPD